MPDQDQNPNPHDDDLALDGLDLEGEGGTPDEPDDLSGLEDDLAGLDDDPAGDELADPDEPPPPEDTGDNLETDEDLDPDEHRIEAAASVNQRFGSRNRNPERRKAELAMFQDFMTTSIPELRAYSSGLQSEAERMQEIKAQREREERRQARLASRTQMETFLEKTEGVNGYEAPVSDLSDNASLLALKETFAPIAGLTLDDFTHTPSTIEEKNAIFPPVRFSQKWMTHTAISPWLRASRGIAGLLPEWHDIEKHDIKTGKPVFKRIGISIIPDEQELPNEAEGFIRREIGPGVIPIGWQKKMRTSGAVYFIGEESSIVILNNSSLADTTSLDPPTGAALTHRSNRIAVAIEGGLKALRRQAQAKAPMAGRDAIESIVQGQINLLSTSPQASKTIYKNAVGASAWDSSTQSEEQNQSVSTATFNNANGQAAAEIAAPVADIRQIARQTISNPNGQHTRAGDNEVTNAVATMTAAHTERSRASSRSNLLKGAPCVRSSMAMGADGAVLTLTTDIGKETLTTAFRVGPNGIPLLKNVVFSSADMEPVCITSAYDQQGNPLNSASSLIAIGTAILDKMEQLRDFFEDGIGNRRDIIGSAETLRSLISNHSGDITGVPYAPEDLAASAASIRAEIDAELQEHRRAATINVFDDPPANEGNAPQLGM